MAKKGSKSSYTDKQKRKAEHIEEGYEARGVSDKVAEARAWATVNKQDGDGKKSGSGRDTPTKRVTRKAATKRATKTTAKKATKTAKKKTSR